MNAIQELYAQKHANVKMIPYLIQSLQMVRAHIVEMEIMNQDKKNAIQQ